MRQSKVKFISPFNLQLPNSKLQTFHSPITIHQSPCRLVSPSPRLPSLLSIARLIVIIQITIGLVELFAGAFEMKKYTAKQVTIVQVDIMRINAEVMSIRVIFYGIFYDFDKPDEP